MKYKIAVNNQTFEVEIKEIKDGVARVNVNGQSLEVLIENYEDIVSGTTAFRPVPEQVSFPKPSPSPQKVLTPVKGPIATPKKPAPTAAVTVPEKAHLRGEIVAPIPGLILDVKVKAGDPVTKGQTVATMEAMKMENNIASTMDGIVQEIRVQKDSEVATGEVIMIVG